MNASIVSERFKVQSIEAAETPGNVTVIFANVAKPEEVYRAEANLADGFKVGGEFKVTYQGSELDFEFEGLQRVHRI